MFSELGKFDTHTKINCKSKFNDLKQAVKNIGNWRDLCENLLVDTSVMNGIEFSEKPAEWKKSDCLKAYCNTGEATWEDVVRAVAQHPINNVMEARTIKEKYIVHKKDEL